MKYYHNVCVFSRLRKRQTDSSLLHNLIVHHNGFFDHFRKTLHYDIFCLYHYISIDIWNVYSLLGFSNAADNLQKKLKDFINKTKIKYLYFYIVYLINKNLFHLIWKNLQEDVLKRH